jgi:hypothetical protein
MLPVHMEESHNNLAPDESTQVEIQTRRHAIARFASRVIGRGKSDASPLGTMPMNELNSEEGTTSLENEATHPSAEAENYDEELSYWVSSLENDIATYQAQSAENGIRTQKTWALYSKMFEQSMAGHGWAQDGDLARQGIAKRYGSQDELREKEMSTASLLSRRREQLDKAVHSNTVLEFADQIDKSTYRRFIPESGQLGERFNLPHTSSPTKDPEQAAQLLNKLPFINAKEVIKPYPRTHPNIVIKGSFDFPTERIVSVESFDSWAGRGETTDNGFGGVTPNGKGGKGFSPRTLHGIEPTSRGAITDYAQEDLSSVKNAYGNADIIIFQDTDDEYWGIATTDGSHRAAAAKLRGESTVAVSEIQIASDDDMPRLDYSVRQRFEASK